MSVSLQSLVSFINAELKPELFSDYCPNGLQVESGEAVAKIVTGVTASQALIERAVDEGADALLVHHGYFWKGEDACISGIKGRRIRTLIQNKVSLLAYHLPLDVHPVLGNNAQLASLLGIQVSDGLSAGDPLSVGSVGRLEQPISVSEFSERVAKALDRKPLTIEAGSHLVETIAWCTGGAQGYIDRAAARGVDAYLSGEISEPTVHSARELGVHYIAAGHHATERYGVKALGEYIAEKLGVESTFIDVDCPA